MTQKAVKQSFIRLAVRLCCFTPTLFPKGQEAAAIMDRFQHALDLSACQQRAAGKNYSTLSRLTRSSTRAVLAFRVNSSSILQRSLGQIIDCLISSLQSIAIVYQLVVRQQL